MSQISALIAANSLPQLATPLIDAAAQQGGNPANSGKVQSPSSQSQDSVSISSEASALSAAEE